MFIILLFCLTACSTSEFTRVGNPPTEPLPEGSEGFTRIGNPPTNPLPEEHFGIGVGKAIYLAGSTEGSGPEHEVYLAKVTDEGATIASTDFPEETTVKVTIGDDMSIISEETVTGVYLTGTPESARIVDVNGITIAKLSTVSVSEPDKFISWADTEARCQASEIKCFDIDKITGGLVVNFNDYATAAFVRSNFDASDSCADKIYDTCVDENGAPTASSKRLAERVCVTNSESGPLHYGTVYAECDCENGRCTGEVINVTSLPIIMKSSKKSAIIGVIIGQPTWLNTLMLPPVKLNIGPTLK